MLRDVVSESDRLPAIFRGVYAGKAFIERLPLYDGKPRERKTAREHWVGLPEIWKLAPPELRARIEAIVPAVAREIEKLRAWEPPPLPHERSGTRFGELYTALATLYVERRDEPRIERVAPWPEPGFTLAYDSKRGVLKVTERASPLVDLRLDFALPLSRPLRNVPIVDGVLARHGTTDAWSLGALRALIAFLHEGTEPPARALEEELSRPVWDQLLDNLGAATDVEAREWAFVLVDGYRDSYEVVAFARSAKKGAAAGKWKKERWQQLYAEEASALERDIARVALCAAQPGRGTRSAVTLGTPQAHELLRLLAQHPRVHVADREGKFDPEAAPPVDIVAGETMMRLERAPNGALVPHFLVAGRELSAEMLANADADSPFRGTQRGVMIASTFVPPALVPWVDLASRIGAQLSFPTEAVPKLVTATKGIAELPRDALGHELTYDPVPALRVEWQPHGGAFVEVFISAHPSAPLVPPGLGPTLFTFEHQGRRVFVERDPKLEKKVAEQARATIPIPLPGDELEETVRFADWLDENPLGLRIEVALGRRPTIVRWTEAGRSLKVRQEGSWLVLDGALDVAGIKLTLGDVLDAARIARRFAPAGDGIFLELSQDIVDLAIAADLAPESPDGAAPRVHEAFSPYVAAAFDAGEYARRFRTRQKEPKVPALDRGKLRAYQKEGAAWMLGLGSWAPGCVLADDMGLGKTVQTAAALKARAALGPQLIIAPASVVSNWHSELARFVPSVEDVTVVSYQTLQRQSATATFAAQHWATLVIDEAQYVKNVAAQRTDAVRGLSRDFTIALTGTPLENHLGELFSITDLVFPGLLGSERLFRDRFRKPIEGTRDETRLAVLARLLSPFLLRRTRKDVLRELPPREEITVELDLSPEENKDYLALRRVCEQQFSKRKREETPAQLRVAIFAAMTRLRQLACSETKIAHVVDFARELAQEGNHALVFSQFTGFLTRIREALQRAGLRVAYLAGDTPVAKRKAIIDRFQAGEYDVFCVSLLAGGTGLNLTKASYVIHTDPWWNPAAEEQATSRAHRMGQDEPVTVYRLVAKGTIEEAVLAMHADKRDLAAAVLEGKAKAKAISSKELIDMLRFGG